MIGKSNSNLIRCRIFVCVLKRYLIAILASCIVFSALPLLAIQSARDKSANSQADPEQLYEHIGKLIRSAHNRYERVNLYAKVGRLYERMGTLHVSIWPPRSARKPLWYDHEVPTWDDFKTTYEEYCRLVQELEGTNTINTALAVGCLAARYSRDKYAESQLVRARDILQQAMSTNQFADLGDSEKKNLLIEADSLSSKVVQLYNDAKLAQAIPQAHRVYDIRIKLLGIKHAATIAALVNLASIYRSMDIYELPEPLYQHPLKIREMIVAYLYDAIGEDKAEAILNQRTVAATNRWLRNADEITSMVLAAYKQGEYARAINLAERAYDLRQRILGEYHPALVNDLNILGTLYQTLGSIAASVPGNYTRYYQNLILTFGSRRLDVSVRLHNMQLLYESVGNKEEAERLRKRAFDMRQETVDYYYGRGKDISVIPKELKYPDSLEHVTRERARYCLVRARTSFRRALEINEKTYGPNHPNTATSLNNLALLNKVWGGLDLSYAYSDWTDAERLLKRALKIREGSLGAQRHETLEIMNNLALLYKTMERYSEAESFYKRMLNIYEESLGPQHPYVAWCLTQIAGLYIEVENYTKAESFYKQALEILENSFGPDNPHTAQVYEELAKLYQAMGDYKAAKANFEHALKIREESSGYEHPDTTSCISNLANLYDLMGKYNEAEALCRRVLEIREKTLGYEHPQTAEALNDLAMLHCSAGEFQKAEPLLNRSLQIWEKTLGASSPYYAITMENLATAYFKTGQFKKAQELYQESLSTWERTWGEEDPSLAPSLKNLAILLTSQQEMDQALDLNETLRLFSRLWEIRKSQYNQISSFVVEREQLAIAAKINEEINLILSFAEIAADSHLNLSSLKNNAQRFAAEVVLFSKCSVLETLLRRNARELVKTNPRSQSLFKEWEATCYKLKTLEMTESKVFDPEHRKKVDALTKQKETLYRQLEQALPWFSFLQQENLGTVANIGATLPVGSALVEIVKYRPFDFRAEEREEKWGGARYVAFVLHGGQVRRDPEVALVPMGSAVQIEKAVKRWRTAVQKSPEEHAPEQELAVASEALASLIWNPLVPALGNCRKIYISPDGELSFVSFAALPGSPPGRFLIEEYDIGYVSTGRDLVRKSIMSIAPPVLVGAPDFGETKTAALISNREFSTKHSSIITQDESTTRTGISDLRSFGGLEFSSLPGTLEEINIIADVLKGYGFRDYQTLSGAKATEATVKSVRYPQILHLATHGFFLPDTGLDELATAEGLRGVGGTRPYSGDEIGGVSSEGLWHQITLRNPMHRSGIALAGANDTIFGLREAGGNDGILTAEEVTTMDLMGTAMVVISACESGLGEAKGGEGVFGLRRAFTLAGAQSLVMSLWSVPDVATRELMELLYRGGKEAGSTQRALLAAQRQWIEKEQAAGRYPHPFYWAGFVASGVGLGLGK